MHRLILKLVSLKRITAEETLNLQLWTVKLNMFDNPLDRFEFLLAAETLDFISLTLVFKMFFNVFHQHILLYLVVEAFMLDLDLSYHVL